MDKVSLHIGEHLRGNMTRSFFLVHYKLTFSLNMSQ